MMEGIVGLGVLVLLFLGSFIVVCVIAEIARDR